MQRLAKLGVVAMMIDLVAADFCHLIQRSKEMDEASLDEASVSEPYPRSISQCKGAKCGQSKHPDFEYEHSGRAIIFDVQHGPNGGASYPAPKRDVQKRASQPAHEHGHKSVANHSAPEQHTKPTNHSGSWLAWLASFLPGGHTRAPASPEVSAREHAGIVKGGKKAQGGVHHHHAQSAHKPHAQRRAREFVKWTNTASDDDEIAQPLHVFPPRGEAYIRWRLCNASYHNNLGGLGPDEGDPEIRYFGVADAQDSKGNPTSLDLAVEALSEYRAKSPAFNGLLRGDGCFGQINVAASRGTTNSVMLRFNWYLTGTRTRVVIERQYFTIYDVDGTPRSTEGITYFNRVHSVFTSNNTEMKQSGAFESGLTFTAEGLHNNVPLPEDPENMTEEQENRAVTVLYVDKDRFKLQFNVIGGRGGRNFLFSGHSALANDYEPTLNTPTPTASPTPPTPAPTASPTVDPTPAPTDLPTLYPTPAPTALPTLDPTPSPTALPTLDPTPIPTESPTVDPTPAPTAFPTLDPTPVPTARPTLDPTPVPTASPTLDPTPAPTALPTLYPTPAPTALPTLYPTPAPTALPTLYPTPAPTAWPTLDPVPMRDAPIHANDQPMTNETQPSPVPTTPSTCDEARTCSVYEDPHIKVFDGLQISLLHTNRVRLADAYGSGDMWLVKSSNISIQVRFLPDPGRAAKNLFVRAVAVGGSFLNGNTLILGPFDEEILWNGQPILRKQISRFFTSVGHGMVRAHRHTDSHLVENMTKTNAGVDVELPFGVKLTVNRQKSHVNVFLEMSPASGGQDGLCGNFNCRSHDDTLDMIIKHRSPKVKVGESLFQHYRRAAPMRHWKS